MLLLIATASTGFAAAQPVTHYVQPDKPVLLSVRINGSDIGDVVPLLLLPDGRVDVSQTSLAAWRLKPPTRGALGADGKTWFHLDEIDGISFRVDAATQTLLLKVPPSAFETTTITSDGAISQLTPSRLGGFLNYDLQGMRSDGRDNASGLFELGAFNAWGNGTSTALWNSASLYKHWVRLDTTWTFDLPERMQSVHLGDAISRAGTWGRAVRFGGVQWGSNFATQPNFISFPLPILRGEAVLASTFDVYVDSVRRLHGEVPPGPFDLPSIPVINGQGEIELVVSDLLGRQQLITQPYHVSQRMLKPGLHDFSYEAGVVRENYGVESARYGRFMLATTDRFGVSPGFTRELRAEVMRAQFTVGAGGVWLLPGFGTFNLAAAIGHGPRGGGRLLAAGAERQTKNIRFSLHAEYAQRSFVQIGRIPEFAPRRTISASLGVPVGGSGLGIGYVQQTTWQGDATRLLSANYSVRLGQRGQIGFYAMRNVARESKLTVGVMLSLALGERDSASVNVSGSSAHHQSTLQVQRSLPAGDGFGYRLQAGRGEFDQLGASATWRTERGDFNAEAARIEGHDAYRIGVSGGIAAAGGGAFLTRRVNDSFAVVKVDQFAGVRVYRDNQEVTRTDKSGLALVTSLRAYEENLIGIEQADLPLDAEVDSLALTLTPALRSSVVATFPVRRMRAATFRLVDQGGRPLPAGSTIRLEGQDREFSVGYAGKTFVTGLAPHNRLLSQWGGKDCAADLDYTIKWEPLPDLGTIICR